MLRMTEKKRWLFILLICVLTVLFANSKTMAEEKKPKLTLNIIAEKEIKKIKNGKEITEKVPLDKTPPGDIITYTIKYTNDGKSDAKNAFIIDPIPKGTVYIAGSAKGENTDILYSIDGSGSYRKSPITTTVKKDDGSAEQKLVSAEKYTHLKWLFKKSIAPGDSGTVFFKVKVK